jgi:RimJ/RimL family protein N-acetyltransferase
MARDLDEIDWPLRTERLSIRRATEDDLEATWAFRQLPEVCEWLTLGPSDKDEYTARYLSQSRLSKTLIVEVDGNVVGDLMLSIDDAWAQVEVAEQAKRTQAELGWVIAPEHAGRGYATEAARELLRLCFEDLGVRRVTASCFADNAASWKLMERLGMRREVHSRQESLHRSGTWLDGLTYAILAEEWRGRDMERERETA